jgi:NADH-ubiquinone oxidoreductase chain 4
VGSLIIIIFYFYEFLLLSSLLFIPLIGIFLIASDISYENTSSYPSRSAGTSAPLLTQPSGLKVTAFITSIVNLIVSLVIFILFDFSSNQFQFVQEHYELNLFDLYLGVDGISIYFVLLTTIIMPIAILSN